MQLLVKFSPHGELFLLSFDLLDGDVQMLFVTILSSSGAGSSWNQEENYILPMVFLKAHSVQFKNVSTQVAQLGLTFFHLPRNTSLRDLIKVVLLIYHEGQ